MCTCARECAFLCLRACASPQCRGTEYYTALDLLLQDGQCNRASPVVSARSYGLPRRRLVRRHVRPDLPQTIHIAARGLPRSPVQSFAELLARSVRDARGVVSALRTVSRRLNWGAASASEAGARREGRGGCTGGLSFSRTGTPMATRDSGAVGVAGAVGIGSARAAPSS